MAVDSFLLGKAKEAVTLFLATGTAGGCCQELKRKLLIIQCVVAPFSPCRYR
jgi:hypothetical protein